MIKINYIQTIKIILNYPFVEQRKNINRSTLYGIKRSFELLHGDIADIRFFSKSAVNPEYCLLIFDLFMKSILIL